MYSIKKFAPGQEILRIKLEDGKSLVWECTTAKPNFVIMKDNKPFFAKNRLTGKKDLEVFGRKVTAQRQADWYNANC